MQEPVYNFLMAPLVVFLIDSEDKLKKWEKISIEKTYHRCFILANLTYKNNLNLKKTDSVFIFDFKKFTKNLLKLVTSYNNAIYSHFLILYEYCETIDEKIEKLKNIEYFYEYNNIYFSKNYYVMNEMTYNIETLEVIDLYEMSRIMTKYYDDQLLSNSEFKIVMTELLPELNYSFDENLNLETDLMNIICSKISESAASCLVTNKSNEKHKIICFSFDEIINYKIVIRRDDGLNLYIS